VQEVAIFQQIAANFQLRRSRVLNRKIINFSTPKMGIFRPRCCMYFGRKIFRRAKYLKLPDTAVVEETRCGTETDVQCRLCCLRMHCVC